MKREQHINLALIGCGQLFDEIVACWPYFETEYSLRELKLSSTDAAAADTAVLLEGMNPAETCIFAAVDYQALNHARQDVYGRARLMGFRAASLRHPSAIVAESARVGENCWIGAGAIISHGAVIGNNTIIGDAARVEACAKLGSNCWIGTGASVGAGAVLGQHCIIGKNVHFGSKLHMGRHCSIDVPGDYTESLPDGTFIDPLFASPVRIYDGRYET